MKVDVQDEGLRVRMDFPRNGMVRLTVDYPQEAYYRNRVMTALADLLRPTPEVVSGRTQGRGAAKTA
jgi:hypothetical protein